MASVYDTGYINGFNEACAKMKGVILSRRAVELNELNPNNSTDRQTIMVVNDIYNSFLGMVDDVFNGKDNNA